MAWRKRTERNKVELAMSDNELKSLALICKVADQEAGLNGVARRWEVFFINARASKMNDTQLSPNILSNYSEG